MNDLENRLTGALHARADLVEPHHLTPDSPPAAVVPLRRRTASVVTATVAGLAAAAAVVALVVGSGDDTGAAPTGPAASDTAPTDTAPTDAAPTDAAPTDAPRTALDDLLPADQPPYVEPGRTIALRDGATAVVDGGRLEVTAVTGTPQLQGVLTGFDPAAALAVTQVSLDDAGTGYLVAQTLGGDSLTQVLYVEGDGGGLVPAEPVGDVPFGFAMAEGVPGGHLTWTTDDGRGGLYTRVQDGQDLSRFVVYRWQVTVPGDAGPEAAPTALVATRVGAGCFDLEADEVVGC